MIIKKLNDVEVFEFLLQNFYREFTIEELSNKLGLSVPKLYKTVNLFKKYALIRIRTSAIRIDMNNIFVHYYKLLKDSEKILQLKEPFLTKIGRAKHQILMEYEREVKSIIIFGSLASGEYNQDSDADILIIKKDESKELDLSFLKFEDHIIQKTESEINNNLNKGDDFLISILKNNIIYYDSKDFFYDLMKVDMRSIPHDLIIDREKQLEILRKQILADLKKNRLEEGVENFKKFFLLSSRIELLRYSLTQPYSLDYVPITKKDTLNKISKLKKENIMELYDSINKTNLKRMVERYV